MSTACDYNTWGRKDAGHYCKVVYVITEQDRALFRDVF